MIAVLMGVSGAGKTTLGRLLAAELGWPFMDADDFHPTANVAKMKAGLPLTDADREPWLETLAAELRERLGRGESAVLACSALKHAYRERLRVDGSVRFVYLHAVPELIRQRLAHRPGHFFPQRLLDSQLETLEEPARALSVDVSDTPDVVVNRIVDGLGLRPILEANKEPAMSDKVLYTAQTHTTGGREKGVARSSDGHLDIRLSTPGTGGPGTNPEQLFAAGWSACFEGALAFVAHKQKVTLPADTAIDAEVDLMTGDGGFFLRARLNVSLPGLEREAAQALVNAADQTCPYSKAIRGNVDVTITLV